MNQGNFNKKTSKFSNQLLTWLAWFCYGYSSPGLIWCRERGTNSKLYTNYTIQIC